jgi:hypothetical protein
MIRVLFDAPGARPFGLVEEFLVESLSWFPVRMSRRVSGDVISKALKLGSTCLDGFGFPFL